MGPTTKEANIATQSNITSHAVTVLVDAQTRISTVGIAAALGGIACKDAIDTEIMLRISERLRDIAEDIKLVTDALSV
jgi:hypothetical protein